MGLLEALVRLPDAQALYTNALLPDELLSTEARPAPTAPVGNR
jgi:hypothetical protein